MIDDQRMQAVVKQAIVEFLPKLKNTTKALMKEAGAETVLEDTRVTETRSSTDTLLATVLALIIQTDQLALAFMDADPRAEEVLDQLSQKADSIARNIHTHVKAEHAKIMAGQNSTHKA